ncbi:response regulator [Candidatus Woesearchaeota archaeon]|nr:response regulator [Candidatus Woesearchaeota archaeon]
MVEIYLISGKPGHKERALEIADYFLLKQETDKWVSRIALSLEGKKVMVVDDNLVYGSGIAHDFERYSGCHASYNTRADVALICFQEYRPDVIISDIDMPGMNGIEFAKRIRELDKQ